MHLECSNVRFHDKNKHEERQIDGTCLHTPVFPLMDTLTDLKTQEGQICSLTDRPIDWWLLLIPDFQSVWVNSHQLSEERLIVTAVGCACMSLYVWDLHDANRLSGCCLCLNTSKVTLRDLWPCLKPVTSITSCLSGWYYPKWDRSMTLFHCLISSITIRFCLFSQSLSDLSLISLLPFLLTSPSLLLLFILFTPLFLGRNITTISLSPLILLHVTLSWRTIKSILINMTDDSPRQSQQYWTVR